MAVYDNEDDEREWQAHLARERGDAAWARGYRDSAAQDSPVDVKEREANPQEGAPSSDQELYDREFKGITDNLKQEEKPEDEPEDSLYSGNGGEGGDARSRARQRLSTAGKWAKKNKWKLIAGGVGTATPIIVTVLIQIATLLFPNLEAHMTSDRFKSLHRKFFNSTRTISNLKVAYASSSDPKYLEAAEAYRDDGRGLMSKINKYRPEKVAEQMLLDVEYVFDDKKTFPGGLVREKLVGVRVKGEFIPIPENTTGILGKVRIFDYISQLRSSGKSLRAALGVEGRLASVVSTRGRAVKLLRAEIKGIKMYRWTKDEVDKADKHVTDPAKLAQEAVKASYQTATNGGESKTRGAEGVKSDDIKETLQEAAAAEAQCVEDAECLKQMIERGDGVAPTVDQIVADAYKPSLLRKATAGLSATVEGATLVCLLYDASIGTSKGVMAANSQSAIRTWHSMAAASHQQRYTQTHSKDKRTSSKLTGAYAQQASDANNSVPERKANTGVGDTSESPSPHASAAGFFGTDTLGNFLNFAASSAMTSVIDPFCAALTNVWGGVAVTVTELLVSLIPGVGQGMKAGGTVAVKATVKILSKQFAEMLRNNLTKKQLAKMGAEVGAIELTTYLARAITLQRLAIGFNGAAVGAAYINQADVGAALTAMNTDRLANASLPITTAAYTGSQVLDQAYLREQVEGQSTYQRYLALDNPDSLVAKTAMAANYRLRLSSIPLGLQNIAKLFNPFNLFGSLASIGTARGYVAGDDPILTEHYGITPWGWSVDEEEAYIADPEYSPLYNEKKLQESGMEAQIVEKYGKCFDPAVAVEDLITDGLIVRDDQGNLIPERSHCSSHNMGDSGPDGDGKLTFKSPEAQIGFRWRIQQRNLNAANELAELTDPTESDNPNASGATGTGLVNGDGYSWPVEDQTKREYGGIPCEKTFCHHDNTGAADLMYGSSAQMGGKAVYAISNGQVVRARVYREVAGCYSIQFKSDKDGFFYWYGHLQNIDKNLLKATTDDPVRVNAGVKMAEVAGNQLGPVCHGRNPDKDPAPHLHIDRGCVRRIGGELVPQWGGSKGCRDPSFVEFLEDIWSKLPAKP